MRYGCVLAGLIFVCAMQVFGQERGGVTTDRVDITFGTAFMHVGVSPAFNAPGLDLGSQYHLTSWLGYSGQMWFGTSANATVRNYLFGPEVTLRRRVSPFAHVLIGVAHLSQNNHADTSFGAAVGGGITLKVESRVSWRVFELDYAPTYFRSGRQDNIRFSSGFTLRF